MYSSWDIMLQDIREAELGVLCLVWVSCNRKDAIKLELVHITLMRFLPGLMVLSYRVWWAGSDFIPWFTLLCNSRVALKLL